MENKPQEKKSFKIKTALRDYLDKWSQGRIVLPRYGSGFFCLCAGLVFLILGLIPVVQTARERPNVFPVPGESQIDIKVPGSYIALTYLSGKDKGIETRLNEIEYFMSDKMETEVVEIRRMPSTPYVTEKSNNQFPLFLFAVDRAGKYILSSRYPYDMEGPSVTAYLMHMDLRYVKAQFIVGTALFVIFSSFGLYLFYKQYRLKNPKKVKPPKGEEKPV